MEAVTVEVIFVPRLPACGIQREPLDHIVCHPLGQSAFAGNNAKAIERRLTRGITVQGFCRQLTDRIQPRFGIRNIVHCPAMVLPVGHVVAFATPCIEQPHALPRGAIE